MNSQTLNFATSGAPFGTRTPSSSRWPPPALRWSWSCRHCPSPTSLRPSSRSPLPVGFSSIAGTSNESERRLRRCPAGDQGRRTRARTSPGCLTRWPVRARRQALAAARRLTSPARGCCRRSGAVGFVDNQTGFSLGTQYNFAVRSDTRISTESVAQNPAVVDVEVCTVTNCSHDPETDSCSSIHPATRPFRRWHPPSGPLRAGMRLSSTERTSDASSLWPSARSSPSRPPTRRRCWAAAPPTRWSSPPRRGSPGRVVAVRCGDSGERPRPEGQREQFHPLHLHAERPQRADRRSRRRRSPARQGEVGRAGK